MTRISDRTVVFADLRGSTALYEKLGNAEATSVVTHTVNTLAQSVSAFGGHVVKTLGDGLMAVFDDAQQGIDSAAHMHEALDRLVQRGSAHGASAGLRGLRLQVALAKGEVVEMGGDCFGDAVNVSARLLDHAGDNETLITEEVLASIDGERKARFRSLDWVHLRGRAEPVHVHLLGGRRHNSSDTVATAFGAIADLEEPDGIRLVWGRINRLYSSHHLPVTIGRSPQTAFAVDDSRVSRQHARLDWQGGVFSLVDMSINGTYVRFASTAEVVTLKRGSCTLHGEGIIGLGAAPGDPTAAVVRFSVVHYGDTQPQTDFEAG
jgi:adenylate cyclase